jgi:hypothetical protein
MQALMTALMAAGHKVAVVTGVPGDKVVPQDTIDKAAYLQSLGCAECYDQLVVLAEPHDENKAEWLKANHADLLVDNNKSNAKAAMGTCCVLVPWASRKK